MLPSDRMILQWHGMVEPGRPTRYLLSRDARFISVEFDTFPTDPHVLVTSRKPDDLPAFCLAAITVLKGA